MLFQALASCSTRASILRIQHDGRRSSVQQFPRITRMGHLPENLENAAEPRPDAAEPHRTLEWTPQRPLITPLRSKFPQKASERVVPMRNVEKGALEKNVICIKLSEVDVRLCDDFAHPSCDCQQFCRNLARDLRQICATTPCERPAYSTRGCSGAL